MAWENDETRAALLLAVEMDGGVWTRWEKYRFAAGVAQRCVEMDGGVWTRWESDETRAALALGRMDSPTCSEAEH